MTNMQGADLIHQYFPKLSPQQQASFNKLSALYETWNSRINVISRKDMDNFYERHVLHALSIAEFISFHAGAHILDLGTGGGFPGIPLAILFPDTHFTLCDSIGKKMQVVNAVTEELQLENITPVLGRAESLAPAQFDFIVTRAVAPMRDLIHLGRPLLSKKHIHPVPNGIIALKGGDLKEELKGIHCMFFPISDWFEEEYFITKKLVYWHPGKGNK